MPWRLFLDDDPEAIECISKWQALSLAGVYAAFYHNVEGRGRWRVVPPPATDDVQGSREYQYPDGVP